MMANDKLKLMIVDDEAPARIRLREILAEQDDWEVVAEAANGQQALDLCNEQQPDVALLDIRMPGMDGLELAAHLDKLERPPAIIFITAYDEYAVQAFETLAVGYLLKPVRRAKLQNTLEKALQSGRIPVQALQQANPAFGARRNITVTQSGNIRLIEVSRVIAFHADQKYVRMVHTSNNMVEESLISESLKELEQEFQDEFVRVHRSSLVRVDAVEDLTRDA
ncbi:MAG: LytR/AlgR family response regulator transcription factor, partial [Gammaproteobacteria bacterium]